MEIHEKGKVIAKPENAFAPTLYGFFPNFLNHKFCNNFGKMDNLVMVSFEKSLI
jgi:hypothetical protein